MSARSTGENSAETRGSAQQASSATKERFDHGELAAFAVWETV